MLSREGSCAAAQSIPVRTQWDASLWNFRDTPSERLPHRYACSQLNFVFSRKRQEFRPFPISILLMIHPCHIGLLEKLFSSFE